MCNLVIDEAMAWVIVGGISVSWSQNESGIYNNKIANQDKWEAEEKILCQIHEEYPHVLEHKKYKNIPTVQNVLNH